MTVWVVEFDREDDYHEVVGVYANEDLATAARLERAAEEDVDPDEFSVSIKEFDVVGIQQQLQPDSGQARRRSTQC